jgi:hypothetical protein
VFCNVQQKYLLKRVARELYAWSKCKHNNVVQLLGLVVFRGRIAMVSQWMENRSVNELDKSDDTIDRYQLVSLKISELPGFCY